MRLNITNFENWGKLVKTWSTGNNTYLKDGNSYPVPRSKQELVDQMAKAKAGTVPDRIQTVQFVQMDYANPIFLLPPQDIIEKMDGLPSKPGPNDVYEFLPGFYAENFGDIVRHPADFQKFNAQRVGEYTANSCG